MAAVTSGENQQFNGTYLFAQGQFLYILRLTDFFETEMVVLRLQFSLLTVTFNTS